LSYVPLVFYCLLLELPKIFQLWLVDVGSTTFKYSCLNNPRKETFCQLCKYWANRHFHFNLIDLWKTEIRTGIQIRNLKCKALPTKKLVYETLYEWFSKSWPHGFKNILVFFQSLCKFKRQNVNKWNCKCDVIYPFLGDCKLQIKKTTYTPLHVF